MLWWRLVLLHPGLHQNVWIWLQIERRQRVVAAFLIVFNIRRQPDIVGLPEKLFSICKDFFPHEINWIVHIILCINICFSYVHLYFLITIIWVLEIFTLTHKKCVCIFIQKKFNSIQNTGCNFYENTKKREKVITVTIFTVDLSSIALRMNSSQSMEARMSQSR